MKKTGVLIVIIVLLVALGACTDQAPAPPTSIQEPTQQELPSPAAQEPTQPSAAPTATQPPEPTATEAPPPTATEPPTPEPTTTPTVPVVLPNPLGPEAIPLSIPSESGATLEGTYYPAATTNAPLVLLFHWAAGDQYDWTVIARWLQNRGVVEEGVCKIGPYCPWMDASWFPPLSPDTSFAVMTVSFNGCGQAGCQVFDRQGWLPDAYAAIEKAVTLENIDPSRIMAVGASIGADGAIDACAHLNALGRAGEHCTGAFSLSPGSYLTKNYAEAVKELTSQVPPVPAWCLAADGDVESVPACTQGLQNGGLYLPYTGSAHGMMLIQPEQIPTGMTKNTLELLLDFLKLASAK